MTRTLARTDQTGALAIYRECMASAANAIHEYLDNDADVTLVDEWHRAAEAADYCYRIASTAFSPSPPRRQHETDR